MKKSILFLGLNILLIHVLSAQLFINQQIMYPNTLSAGDSYGGVIEANDEFLFVSATWDNTIGPEVGAGAVYVYQFDGTNWNFTQKLLPHYPSTGWGDRFGSAISVQGEWLVIVAQYDDEFSGPDYSRGGAAYIYHYNGSEWEEVDYFAHPDVTSEDSFGCDVEISGDFMAISARDSYGDDDAIYIYTLNEMEWTFFQKLTPEDYTGVDNYGQTISLEGNLLLVGSGDSFDEKGGAWLYEFNDPSWELVQQIDAPTKEWNFFGYSLAVHNNNILIGAFYHNSGAGTAYMYSYDGTTLSLDQQLDIVSSSSAGDFVGFVDDYAVVHWVSADRSNLRFYEYTNEWTFVEDVYSDDESNDNTFKNFCDNSNFLFCGASGYDGFQSDAGAINILTKNPQTPTSQAKNIVVTNLSSSEVLLSWDNGSGNGRAVFMSEANTGEPNTSDDLFYNANSVFGLGDEANSDGWFCVASGDISEANITGLAANTEYRVMVCEFNNNFDLIKYQNQVAVNNPINFTTTATNVYDEKNDISVYPNPVFDQKLKVKTNQTNSHILISNILGEIIVDEFFENDYTIDLQNGIYVVNVKTQNSFKVQKIIVK